MGGWLSEMNCAAVPDLSADLPAIESLCMHDRAVESSCRTVTSSGCGRSCTFQNWLSSCACRRLCLTVSVESCVLTVSVKSGCQLGSSVGRSRYLPVLNIVSAWLCRRWVAAWPCCEVVAAWPCCAVVAAWPCCAEVTAWISHWLSELVGKVLGSVCVSLCFYSLCSVSLQMHNQFQAVLVGPCCAVSVSSCGNYLLGTVPG